jgi:hypothetical protein
VPGSQQGLAQPGASGSLRRPDGSRRTIGDVPQPPSASRQLPALPIEPSEPSGGELARILPQEGALIRADTTRVPPSLPVRTAQHRGRTLVTSVAILVTVIVSLGFGAAHALQSGNAGAEQVTALHGTPVATGTPPPSGSAPPGVWEASAGAVVYIPPPPATPTPGLPGAAAGTSLTEVEPCRDTVIFPANIGQWSIPNGCYADVYVPNPANYPYRPIFGWCNWWVMENHLKNPTITMGGQIYVGTTVAPGEAVFFSGGVEGASAEGHWAEVVAVAPDHYWFLLSEMNFAWRGAGFSRVDYRYAHVGPGVSFYE